MRQKQCWNSGKEEDGRRNDENAVLKEECGIKYEVVEVTELFLFPKSTLLILPTLQ